MKITVEGHEVDTLKRDKDVYEEGGMICVITPWASSGCPLTLEICITPTGQILHRGWNWRGDGNAYLHTATSKWNRVNPTQEMAETVAGLFSGRITVDGIKLPVGASVQEICPIDLKAEEKRIDAKIYLA